EIRNKLGAQAWQTNQAGWHLPALPESLFLTDKGDRDSAAGRAGRSASSAGAAPGQRRGSGGPAPPVPPIPSRPAAGRGRGRALGRAGARDGRAAPRDGRARWSRLRAGDPYGRPARRTQWLVSALAYDYGLDRGVENEIVVLATGLDQYLQEIFHHLDCAGAGRIPGEDFRTLCQVLGLEEAADPEECAGLWDGLSAELTFRQFHARLCGHFSTRAGGAGPRLPLGRESEHIETQIRLRSPRRRRRADPAGRGAAGSAERRTPGPCSRECYEEIVALEQAEDRIAKLEEENGSLRELVEDMRAALQSSDARCLALQVGLRKSHASHKEEGTCFIGSKRPLTQNHSQTKCLQSVLKEMELIRSSRDGQIEEAIEFNQELERELKSSQEALVSLEDCNCNLKREQAETRRKVEEARHAVLNSLGKVKELEEKANEVPHLQIYIQQLESQLQHYSRCQHSHHKVLSAISAAHTWRLPEALGHDVVEKSSETDLHVEYPFFLFPMMCLGFNWRSGTIWHFKQMLPLENQIYAAVGVFLLALTLHHIWSPSLLKPALTVALTPETKVPSVPGRMRALKVSSI
uniref:Uncharacterized protein n=1 Tax=Corvus moneduloides TaxID=1196302 RepID=A0A8U7NZB9_CORMO